MWHITNKDSFTGGRIPGGKRKEWASEFGNMAHCKQMRTHLLERRKRE